jgi:hypothetical protein
LKNRGAFIFLKYLYANPAYNMALQNYDRIMFVDGTDTLYNDSAQIAAYTTFLQQYAFNGVYFMNTEPFFSSQANWPTMASFISQSHVAGATIRGIVFGDNDFTPDTIGYNQYNGTAPYTNIGRFCLYNDYWDSGSMGTSGVTDWEEWSASLDTAKFAFVATASNTCSVDFYMGYYQDSQSIKLPIQDLNAGTDQLNASQHIFFSAWDMGVPRYPYVNSKTVTNIVNRLDTIAEAAYRRNTTASLYFYIHAGQVLLGSSADYSGFSIRNAGNFDTFENYFTASVVDRMTAFQRQWINVKGFAYHNKTYLNGLLNPSSSYTGSHSSSISGSFRSLKLNNISTYLGNSVSENAVLSYCQTQGMNWIQFYGLNSVLGTGLEASLPNFIRKAKTTYSMSRVGAIRDANGTTQWQQVFDYNQNVAASANEQFNDFNLENEFWFWPFTVAHPEALPFSSTVNVLQFLRNKIDNVYLQSGSWIISCYTQNYLNSSGTAVRWANPYLTASILAQYLDVYEATDYHSGAPNEPIISRGGQFEQLNYLASGAFSIGKVQEFVPIISAESAFSGPWLGSNGLNAGEAIWTASYISDISFPHKTSLYHLGYSYFAYNDLHSYVSSSNPVTSSASLPAYDHVITVILENHQYNSIVGNGNAPFFNNIINGTYAPAALIANSYGTTHPSQPNYMDLLWGRWNTLSPQPIVDNNQPSPLYANFRTQENIAHTLETKSKTWQGVAQGLPAVGSTYWGGQVYAARHFPFYQAANINHSNEIPLTNWVSGSGQYTSMAYWTFVVPDNDHNWHNSTGTAGLVVMDNWLGQWIVPLVQWASTHNSLVILTFDEDDGGAGNHIPTVLAGQHVVQGTYNTAQLGGNITHHSLLRLWLDLVTGSYWGNIGSATKLDPIFS